MLWGLFALDAVFKGQYGHAYWWMAFAVLVDSTDGPMARKIRIREVVPEIDGALLDNIVDFLTWTFVPLVLIWHAGWLPDPSWPWVTIGLLGSLYAFSHADAKQTKKGFFRGFPSYWNFAALYIDVGVRHLGQAAVAATVVALAILSVLPVRFVYPNRVKRFRGFFIGGLILSAPLFFYMFTIYPDVPLWLVGACTAYPAVYIVLSLYLDWDDRRRGDP
ncbi:MAG: CDP-diacylglycerol O-phosphatidyltransferase [Alphaproteobacteria bacterium]|nr:CDP-diacylglycerol O-phosphatidyltransferase [Alphaproteobacteria bacterium]MCB9796820.1 CDP-diacylglycerol O-phosphatidyltransferase [Alphaproteobacteria bacterium]